MTTVHDSLQHFTVVRGPQADRGEGRTCSWLKVVFSAARISPLGLGLSAATPAPCRLGAAWRLRVGRLSAYLSWHPEPVFLPNMMSLAPAGLCCLS